MKRGLFFKRKKLQQQLRQVEKHQSDLLKGLERFEIKKNEILKKLDEIETIIYKINKRKEL